MWRCIIILGKKVIHKNEVHEVIHDYKNGQIEIRKEGSLFNIILVSFDEVEFIEEIEEIEDIV